MPQAALAVAAWVGQTVFQVASAIGMSVSAAATAANVAAAATLAVEAYAVVKATEAMTPKIRDQGSTVQWQADPRAGVPYGMGRCAIGGNIVFNQSSGSGNKYLNFATVYSGAGPIQGFEAFQCNGVTVSFTADSGEGASGYYLNRMWQKRQLGLATEGWMRWTAVGSKDTPSDHGGMPSEWTAAHKLSGYAATLWALEYDPERFASGVPSPRMVGRWVKVYDPRKDSTFPGGNGPHRIDDETTWEWSANPGLHGLTWIIGRRSGGILILGLGAFADEIDIPAFVHLANVCDANGWTMGGSVTSADNTWEVLKAILQSGAATPILGGSQISCLVNAPSASLVTVTDDDIVGTATVPAQVSADEAINTVWPSYTEEALDWEVVTPDAPVQVAAYVDADGEERSVELGLPLVQQAIQVGQLCRYAIEDARELNGIVLMLKPWLRWVPPGSCALIQAPETGLNGQKIRLLKRTREMSTKTVGWTMRTETDAKHGYALGQVNDPPSSRQLTSYDPAIVPVPTQTAFELIAGQVAGAGGALPAIVVEGQADLYEAVSVVVDYRQVFPTQPVTYGVWQSQTFSAKTTRLIVTGVEAGAKYQVRIRYITANGVENAGTGTDLGEVAVGGVDAGTVQGREVVQDILDLIETYGDTASAAASAAAADAARDAAELAREQATAKAADASGSSLAAAGAASTAVAKSAEAAQSATASFNQAQTAGGHAQTAVGASAAATAAAAAAQQSSTLAASVGPGVLNKNPVFSDYPTTTGVPGSWFDWTRGDLGTRQGGEVGLYAYEVDAPTTDDHGIQQFGIYSAPGWYVIEADAWLQSGTWSGACVLFWGPSEAGKQIDCATDPDIGDVTGALGPGVRRFRKMVQIAAAEAKNLYCMTNFAAVSPKVAKRIRWYRVAVRPATEGEIKGRRADGNAGSALAQIAAEAAIRASETGALTSSVNTHTSQIGGLTSTVTAQAGTLADHTGKLAAYLKWTAAAGSDEAKVEVAAGGGNSIVRLVAKTLSLATAVGGAVFDVLTIVGDVVRFARPIEIVVGGAKLCLGPGFGAGGNLVMWFGPSIAQAQMTKGNATFWLDNAGGAYFGGSIMSGRFSNSATGTDLSVPASLTLGPFGTNGQPITVNWSYVGSREGWRAGNQSASGTYTVGLALYRTIAGQAETLVDTKAISGNFDYLYYDGEFGRTMFRESISGAFTFTDTAGGVANRTYRVAVTSRSFSTVAGNSSQPDSVVQRYSLVTSEN
ncbi:phage tail protein [Caulobacter endophyticus]|uniref:hypothetical protein n=1 Tax=Caulobacter endophyticus TaxID=2172652 RepID=UPI0011B20C4B|nr:hypothetical protein [Caulobacter endophyticus]